MSKLRAFYGTPHRSSLVCWVTQDLEISKAKMLVRLTNGIVDRKYERPGFYRQVSTLLWRDSVVAVRDPTLYYLQVRH